MSRRVSAKGDCITEVQWFIDERERQTERDRDRERDYNCATWRVAMTPELVLVAYPFMTVRAAVVGCTTLIPLTL